MKLLLAASLMVLILAGCSTASAVPTAPSPPALVPTATPPSTTTMPIMLTSDANNPLPQRGVNFGNALEGHYEGEWGVVLEESYFRAIRDGGFGLVRVPIRWSAHADAATPYAISPAFFERIDWVIAQCQANGLTVIINMHHYDELFSEPTAHSERFVALWRQIAARYQQADDTVVFELLNEPHDRLQGQAWHTLMTATLSAVRETNPERWVVLGGDGWNSVSGLHGLALPEDDRHLIATVHYYEPFQFTHQGAEWADGADAWLGTTWTAAPAEMAAVRRDLDRAAAWAEAHDRPLLLGEFGAYYRADAASRMAWTAFVAREAEARGMAWAYWEFCAGFGVYDPVRGTYREELLKALAPAP